jgi:hypothetical protein
MACADNKWLPTLDVTAAETGLALTLRAYDIVAPEPGRRAHYMRGDWATLRSNQVGPSDALVMCVAPPWGHAGVTATAVLAKALSLRPRRRELPIRVRPPES